MRSGDCPQCLHEKGAVWLPPKKQILLASQQYDHFCGYNFDPRYLPGCVYLGCTNTAAFGSGAVGFPADPLVNGNFEGAAGPAGWTGFNCTPSRVAGARTGGSGSYVAQIDWDTVNTNGQFYQGGLTVGNTYRVCGWAYSDGTTSPRCYLGTAVIWTHSGAVGWEYFDATGVCAGNVYFSFWTYGLAAGKLAKYDDVTIQCLNSSQLTDLTGLGHHLVQATAASQPLWVASGSGGYLSFDGVADYLKAAAFTLNQPWTVYLLHAWTNGAGQNYLTDGNTLNKGNIVQTVGSPNRRNMYAGGWGPYVTATSGAWCVIDAQFNGASSAIGLNGAVPATGDAGSDAAAGFTLGAGATPGGYSNSKIAGIAIYNTAHLEATRQRVVRWCNRQKAMLAL